MLSSIIPLIIHSEEILPSKSQPAPLFQPNPNNSNNHGISAVGASPALCVRAVESCADAFGFWKESRPVERQKLFNNLAQLLRDRSSEIRSMIQDEISCNALWAQINVDDSIVVAEGCASTVVSGVLSGTVPIVKDPEAHAMVIKEPFGVVLAMAPWNAPLILGLRAVAAAVAAGNTVILKGSEISPRTHFLIAKLFQEAGFPPGVVNYIQHRTEDAASCFEAMISHKAVQKCNFTGSTPVGRHIAQRAGFYLKSVTLELGGKNFAIVMADADLEKAADQVLSGAFLNSGQICMSTDLVLVARSVEERFRTLLHEKMLRGSDLVMQVINKKSQTRIDTLVSDAKDKGAKLHIVEVGPNNPATLIEDAAEGMDFWRAEAFGPILGLKVYDEDEEAVKTVNDSSFGLSGAIFSRNHLHALKIAKSIQTGAVHVNSATVHDEFALPHGGRKESGWGRFGAHWGFEEFLQTKTIILHP
ncbi:putative aldehyde dehydrogenase [Pyrenochaeta sp. MPI-SDFR-AT-0127]|nr:putative aldehyde dehydrogenase [Pyrenochaeta sp. MPI-SDFR-AT-0127]